MASPRDQSNRIRELEKKLMDMEAENNRLMGMIEMKGEEAY